MALRPHTPIGESRVMALDAAPPYRPEPGYRYLAPLKLVYYPLLLGGIGIFKLSGHTPRASRSSMRRLFCMTNGRSNELASRLLDTPAPAPPALVSGVLGTLDRAAMASIVTSLDRHGIHVFESRLPRELCDDLVQMSLQWTATLRPRPARGSSTAKFDASTAQAVRYDFDETTICNVGTVQNLLGDESLLAVATAYLRCAPVNDLVAMWWSAAGAASSEAAQLFHFDLDRLKFLKFFFYLTDVDDTTGPHCYVEGSHIDKPRALARDGRKSDDEIVRHYGLERIREITGAAGTIVAADTRGFHRGKALTRGSRLMLQLEFAGNFFGNRVAPITISDANDQLNAAVTRSPSVFRRFLL